MFETLYKTDSPKDFANGEYYQIHLEIEIHDGKQVFFVRERDQSFLFSLPQEGFGKLTPSSLTTKAVRSNCRKPHSCTRCPKSVEAERNLRLPLLSCPGGPVRRLEQCLIFLGFYVWVPDLEVVRSLRLN